MNICTHITCFFKFDIPTIIVCIPTLLDFTLLTLCFWVFFVNECSIYFFHFKLLYPVRDYTSIYPFSFYRTYRLFFFSVIINHTINTFKDVYYCICTEGSPGYILNCEMLVLEYLHFKLHRIFPNHSPRCVFLSICIQRKSVWVSETIK